jgi:hypothetical protein
MESYHQIQGLMLMKHMSQYIQLIKMDKVFLLKEVLKIN